MGIYQSIKNFGKKALLVGLVGGLVAVISGCSESPAYWKPEQIVSDVNGDNRPDIINYVGVGTDGWGNPKHYQVTVALNRSDGTFGKPKLVLQIPHNLEKLNDIKVEDVDGDNKKDLIYRIDIGTDGWGNPKHYQVMVAHGNGDGTFKEPQTLMKMDR